MSYRYLIFWYLSFSVLLQAFTHETNATRLHYNVTSLRSSKVTKSCNVFEGSWVFDKAYPMYRPSSCPLIRKEFDCIKNGRPDFRYLKYRWKPKNCDIPTFDGKDFLTRFKGKKIMFIGDSLSTNFYNSLICLLHASVPKSNITIEFGPSITTTNFQEYGVQVMMFPSLFLVDIETQKVGRVLNLDSIKYGKIWKKMDVLIFHSWQWWANTKQFSYIQDGNKILKDMNRLVAFRKALMTWAKWVNSDVDPTKTKVFFQGVTPAHYHGRDWNEPGKTNCVKETRPLSGSTYPNVLGQVPRIVNDVLSTITKPVELLDLRTLSGLRKDGHPSKYNGGMDCLHWCIPGIPDVWNQLLYSLLIRK